MCSNTVDISGEYINLLIITTYIVKIILLFLFLCLFVMTIDAQISQSIDVGNHKIDVEIKRKGPLTVIFESGLTKDLAGWNPVSHIVGSFPAQSDYRYDCVL